MLCVGGSRTQAMLYLDSVLVVLQCLLLGGELGLYCRLLGGEYCLCCVYHYCKGCLRISFHNRRGFLRTMEHYHPCVLCFICQWGDHVLADRWLSAHAGVF